MKVPRTLVRNGWTMWHGLVGVAMVGLGFFLTKHMWAEIWRVALDEQSGYLALVPAVAFWLAYVRRQRLQFCCPVRTWVGPVLVAVGWLINAWGQHADHLVVWEVGALLIIVGCLISAVGTDVLRRFFPAFLVLVFLIPIPDTVAPRIAGVIQSVTADVTQIVYGSLGLDLTRAGKQIVVNDVAVPLTETGSVLSVMMVFILMSYAFAFGMPLRNSARAVILAMSPLTALFCIVARSLATTWVYGRLELKQVQLIMDVSAWIMIAAALVCLYGVVRLLAWASVPIRRLPLAYDT